MQGLLDSTYIEKRDPRFIAGKSFPYRRTTVHEIGVLEDAEYSAPALSKPEYMPPHSAFERYSIII